MEAFIVSLLAITVGEIGDKTQLLALLLAARFKRPLPIVAGILVATIANHVIAALLGQWIAAYLPTHFFHYALGISFLVIAAWTLKPDQMEESSIHYDKFGVFMITAVTFFLAETGDKTQIATMALAAKYQDLTMVVCGSTLGILLADVPAVLLGKVMTPQFPFKWLRWTAATIFAVLGSLVLLGVGADYI